MKLISLGKHLSKYSTVISQSILSFLLLVLLSSCSFSSATGPATQGLIGQGAFPNGLPGWAKQNKLRVGIAQGSYENNHGNGLASRIIERQYRLNKQRVEQVRAGQKEESSLDKLYKKCPSLEKEVNQALIETETEKRIELFSSLSSRCPSDPSLMVWLGNEYLESGNYLKARYYADKALSLDYNNASAKELLSKANISFSSQQ